MASSLRPMATIAIHALKTLPVRHWRGPRRFRISLGRASTLGGDTFLGEFHLTRTQVPSGGDLNNPIIIQSYGTGCATLAANADGGPPIGPNKGPKNWILLVDGVSGVIVQDLNVTANGHIVQYGIVIQNTQGQWAPRDFNSQRNAGMIDHIIVQRVDVKCCTIPGPLEGGESGTAIEITGV